MIKIKTSLNLCNIPYVFLDNSHMLFFDNKEKRNEYFENHKLVSFEMSFPYDDNLDRLNVPYNLENLINVNYLYFNEKFYFVTDKVVVNDKITKLILVLDVLQTYLYDCIFYPSFVERCHVPRVQENGLPTNEVVSEGLAIGDYIQLEKEEICDLTSSCVLATTTPLGFMEKNTDGAIGVYLGFPIFPNSVTFEGSNIKYGTKIDIYTGILADHWANWGDDEYRQVNDYIELNYYDYASNSYRVYFRMTNDYKYLSTANTKQYIRGNYGQDYKNTHFALKESKKLYININTATSGVYTERELFTFSEINPINYPQAENYAKNETLTLIKLPSNLTQLLGENIDMENIEHSNKVELPNDYVPSGLIDITVPKSTSNNKNSDSFLYYYLEGGDK